MISEFKKTIKSFFSSQTVKKGQIIIPSLLVIPSLMLFVYLIFETTKLSREKIRRQFAIDSAAFIQMGDYTNLLNRTAYVNGVFPYRVFKEVYECPPNDYLQRTDDSGQECPYAMLYEAGNFPKYTADHAGEPPQALDSKKKWDIKFDATARPGINQNPPHVGSMHTLFTEHQGNRIYLFWDPATGVYKFYAQFYTLLASIEESQIEVFRRLTENFNFFRKSYYLNTGECRDNPAGCAEDGLSSGGGSFKNNRIQKGTNFHMWFNDKLQFWAKVPQSGIPPYYLGKTNPPLAIKIFQLATVDNDALRAAGNGYQIYQGWNTPSNYFNVNFNALVPCMETGRPCVHATVASQCPDYFRNGSSWDGKNNCVWPNPTPKYQTRLYP